MGRGSSSAGGGGKPITPSTDAKSFGSESIYGHNDETDKFFGTNEWIDSLKSSEKSAVTWYTGSAYGPLNENLRSGDSPTDLSKCSDYQQAKIKDLDAALAKGVLKEPVTVYRGSTADLLGGRKTVADIQELVGATIKDKGYVSTSISKGKTFHGEVGYKIVVPSGKGRGAYVGNISNIPGENEFLLKRNSSFKVMGVVYSKSLGKPVVTLQVE